MSAKYWHPYPMFNKTNCTLRSTIILFSPIKTTALLSICWPFWFFDYSTNKNNEKIAPQDSDENVQSKDSVLSFAAVYAWGKGGLFLDSISDDRPKPLLIPQLSGKGVRKIIFAEEISKAFAVTTLPLFIIFLNSLLKGNK